MATVTFPVRPIIKFAGQDELVWALARSAADEDEGTDLSYTVSLDWAGHTHVPVFLRFREPGIVGDQPVSAHDGDFTSPLVEAVRAAVLAAGGEFSVRPGSYFAAFDDFDTPLVIPRGILDNPAEQGAKFTGFETFGFSHGDGTTLIQGITLNDLSVAATPPVNVVAPSLTDTTPQVGQDTGLNFGSWTPASAMDFSDIIYQRQVTEPASFFDDFNRAAEVVTTDPRYTLAAGTASLVTVNFNGVAFGGGGAGTVVLAEDCGDVDHWCSWIQKNTSGGRKRIYIKYTDFDNCLFFREGASNFEVYSRVLGVQALVLSATRALIAGDLFYLECKDEIVTLKRNGAVVGTPYALAVGEIAAFGLGTDIGFGTDTSGTSIAFDDFRHGGFTVGSPVAVLIEGAIGASITPSSDLVGFPIRGGLRPRNSNGPAADYTYTDWSEPVEAVPSVILPANVTPPAFASTTPQVGVEDPISVGVWDNNPTQFRLYVRHDGAGSPTAGPLTPPVNYVPVSADLTHTLQPGCDASNDGGVTWSAIAWGTQTSVVSAAGGGTLNDVQFGPSYGPPVLVDAPADTLVAQLVGVGDAITAATILGDAGGRFKFVELTPGDWWVATAAVTADFEGNLNSSGHTLGAATYSISGRFNNAFEKTFTIRPMFGPIEPTGDATNNIVIPPFTPSGIASAFVSTTPNRTIRIPTSSIGVIRRSPGGILTMKGGHNKTYEGHPRFIWRTDGLTNFDAHNVVWRHMNIQPGADNALAASGGRDVDALANGHAGEVANRTYDILFENCVFAGSNDELVSIISGTGPFAKNIRFYRCLFVEPLRDAGNPKGGNHAFGPIVYSHCRNVLFDKCVMFNGRYRAPMIKTGALGVTVRNCLILHFDGDSHGPIITGPDTAGDPRATTAVLEGNLHYAIRSIAWTRAYHFSECGVGTKFYIPQSGDRMNHFIWRSATIGTPTFASDPIVVGNGIYFENCPSTVLIDYRPFERTDDASVMPTLTAANREDLFNDVLDYVGSRNRNPDGSLRPGDHEMNKYCYDVIHDFRTTFRRGTNRSVVPDQQVYPADLTTWYAASWMGPGTLGSMTDAAPAP